VVLISRKKGESIVLGDDIILTVIEIREDKVRLGVELPHDGTVLRREVYDAIWHEDEGRVVLGRSSSQADDYPVRR
jgi:carbon storage regulator